MDGKEKEQEVAPVKLSVVTPDVINAAIAKYGAQRLRHITVTTGDRAIDYLLRKPTRNVSESVARQKDNLTAANKIFTANCVIAGDSDALENDGDVYAEVMKQIADMQRGAKTVIKKL